MAKELEEKKARPKSEKSKPKSSPHALTKPAGASTNRKRIGRGIGSIGKTSGRGQKGQKSRSGKKIRPGFEGGQLPIHRRVPKRGFTNIFKTTYEPINLFYLEKAGLTGEITAEILAKKGLIRNVNSKFKILAGGDIKIAINITADRASKSAIEKIKKAGGTITLKEKPKAKQAEQQPKE